MIAIVAALLPGGDPVTMILIMIPIVLLYEVSILLASLLDRRAARRAAAEEEAGSDLTDLWTTECSSTSEAPAAAGP